METNLVEPALLLMFLGLLGKARPELNRQEIFFTQHRAKEVYCTGDISSPS